MKPQRHFLMDEPSLPPDALRAGWEPGTEPQADRAERAAAYARDLLGSWSCLAAILILVIAGAATASRHDHRTSGVAAVILLVSGLTLAAVLLVLMATRRLDRVADEQARHDRGSARRAQAVSEEILDQIEQINSGLARLTARVEILHLRRGAAGDDP
jgi:hypothetical protein